MGEIEQVGNVEKAIGTVDDLDIHPKCVAELRRLTKLRFRDPHGFELADQTLNFVLEHRDRDFPEKIRALVAAESTFRVLILASGYRHFDIFFAAIAGMLDEIAWRFGKALHHLRQIRAPRRASRQALGIGPASEVRKTLRLSQC